MGHWTARQRVTSSGEKKRENGVLHRHAKSGPYNTAHMLTFSDRLHTIVTAGDQMDADQMRYFGIWDDLIGSGPKLVSSASTIGIILAWRWNDDDLSVQ